MLSSVKLAVSIGFLWGGMIWYNTTGILAAVYSDTAVFCFTKYINTRCAIRRNQTLLLLLLFSRQGSSESRRLPGIATIILVSHVQHNSSSLFFSFALRKNMEYHTAVLVYAAALHSRAPTTYVVTQQPTAGILILWRLANIIPVIRSRSCGSQEKKCCDEDHRMGGTAAVQQYNSN